MSKLFGKVTIRKKLTMTTAVVFFLVLSMFTLVVVFSANTLLLQRERQNVNNTISKVVTYIEKAAGFADGKEMTIYLNPSDARWKDYLEEHTGMKLTISKEDFIGGVRAVIHERNILVDYAFKGALENESQKFSFKGGAGID